MGDNIGSIPRVRQACDPCRRKKTKCPGEKPACSFCTRLNQSCSYGRTEEVFRIQKDTRHDKRPDGSYSRERVQRLEARVDQIMTAVNILVDRHNEGAPAGSNRFAPSVVTTPESRPRSQSADQDTSTDPNLHFHPINRPIPPNYVLQNLLELYARRVHCQNFPLFNLESLQCQLDRSSPALLRSFLAVTVRYSDDAFYSRSIISAVEFYARTAREMLFAQLAESNGSVELLQALCLLCLSDIADSNKARAWLSIGFAVRIAICSNLMSYNAGRGTQKRPEDVSRCCWTLFVLDRIYGTSFQTLPALPDETILPEKPISVSTPKQTTNTRVDNARGLQIQEERDEGIGSYCLKLLSIWGRLMAFLQDVRQGQLEDAWAPNSTYQQIKSLMFRFETVLPEVHRFHNARLSERTQSDWTSNREYWAGWIFLQMLYHSIHCTLNHPFLHLAETHSRQRRPSPSFLQHATDQAILHAAWIVRILGLLMDKNLTVYDPFIGHLASMAATVLFFLRFSRDQILASRASKDFEVCQRFVDRMADLHPHLQHTKSKLTKVAQSTSQAVQPPKVETALLWDLLDYAVSSSQSDDGADSSGNVELNVNTQFLSPIQENQPRSIEDLTTTQETPREEAEMPDFWTDPSFSFDMVDFSMLPDFSTLTMPQEFYMHGNL